MTDALTEARAKVDEFVRNAENRLVRLPMLGLAVAFARDAERIGGEYDTRRLAGVLTEALECAQRWRRSGSVTLFAGQLLAVLSDLADIGDEDAAEGVNNSADKLPVELVQYGRAAAAMRKDGRL